MFESLVAPPSNVPGLSVTSNRAVDFIEIAQDGEPDSVGKAGADAMLNLESEPGAAREANLRQ